MLIKLLKLANKLDQLGLYSEADLIDEVLKTAGMSPSEYEKYYGREMDDERYNEWKKEEWEKGNIEEVNMEDVLRPDHPLQQELPSEIETDKIINLEQEERGLLTTLTGKGRLAALNYADLVDVYGELGRMIGDSSNHRLSQIYIKLKQKVRQQAQKWKLAYNGEDFRIF